MHIKVNNVGCTYIASKHANLLTVAHSNSKDVVKQAINRYNNALVIQVASYIESFITLSIYLYKGVTCAGTSWYQVDCSTCSIMVHGKKSWKKV